MFNLHQIISHLVSNSGASVQRRSRLKAMKTPPCASLALSFRIASKESGKISEFLISGVNHDSFPNMMSGLADSMTVWISAFLFLIDWQFMIKILRGWFRTAFLVPGVASFVCTIGEEAALGGGGGNIVWYRAVRLWQGRKGLKSVGYLKRSCGVKQRSGKVWHSTTYAFPGYTFAKWFIVDPIHSWSHALTVYMIPDVAWVATNPIQHWHHTIHTESESCQ